jgi:hypothetical protein
MSPGDFGRSRHGPHNDAYARSGYGVKQFPTRIAAPIHLVQSRLADRVQPLALFVRKVGPLVYARAVACAEPGAAELGEMTVVGSIEPNGAEPRTQPAPPPRASAGHGSRVPRAGHAPGSASRRTPARPSGSSLKDWIQHARAAQHRTAIGRISPGKPRAPDERRPHGEALACSTATRSLTSEGDATLWPRHRMSVADRRYSTAGRNSAG